MSKHVGVVRNPETLARVSGLESTGSRPSSLFRTTVSRPSSTRDSALLASFSAERATGTVRELPDLWSREYMALWAHYVCIGVVNGLLQNALQPYCQYVAHGAPNQCATLASALSRIRAHALHVCSSHSGLVCASLNPSWQRLSTCPGHSRSCTACSPMPCRSAASTANRTSSSAGA